VIGAAPRHQQTAQQEKQEYETLLRHESLIFVRASIASRAPDRKLPCNQKQAFPIGQVPGVAHPIDYR
ncbi:MAG: hypothetical protein ACRD3Q_09320, partial [Terriglobales bacterium]